MFSFTKAITFATLAASALVSAVPVDLPVGQSAVSDLTDLVEKRQTGDLLSIVADLQVSIAPAVTELTFITAANATADVITPIVSEITTTVQSAVTSIKALGNSTVTVAAEDISNALAGVISTVATPAGNILALEGIEVNAVTAALSPLGDVLGSLVDEVLALVGEILVVVKQTLDTLLSGLSGILSGLGFTSLLGLLGL